MLNVNEISRLYLGIQGENLARPLVIDVKPWLMLYPEGSVSIWHKRNGDMVPAPTGAVFDDEEGTVTWTPTSTDTYVDGEGEAEIRLTVGTIIKKSRSIITGVSPAVTGAGVPLGSDWQSYIDEVERIKGLAVTAKQGAEAAEAAAEAWATGGSGGTASATNNAKYYSEQAAAAETAADAAQEAAETAQGKAEDAQEAAEDAQEAAETAQGKAEDAQEAAETAQGKAEDAQEAAETAQGKAEDAQEAAESARDTAAQWATGGTTGTPSATNNAKYYSEQAGSSATAASGSATSASGSADTAAQWATGGTTGTPGATNNAKYYAEQAEAAGAEQIALIEAAGADEIDAIEDKGDEVLESIPEDYTNLSNTVDNLSSAKSALNTVTDENILLKWEQGSLDSNTGSEVSSTTKIRTQTIDISEYTSVTFHNTSGYSFRTAWLNSSGAVVKEAAYAAYRTVTSVTYGFMQRYSITGVRVVLSKANESDIVPSDGSALTMTGVLGIKTDIDRIKATLSNDYKYSDTDYKQLPLTDVVFSVGTLNTNTGATAAGYRPYTDYINLDNDMIVNDTTYKSDVFIYQTDGTFVSHTGWNYQQYIPYTASRKVRIIFDNSGVTNNSTSPQIDMIINSDIYIGVKQKKEYIEESVNNVLNNMAGQDGNSLNIAFITDLHINAYEAIPLTVLDVWGRTTNGLAQVETKRNIDFVVLGGDYLWNNKNNSTLQMAKNAYSLLQDDFYKFSDRQFALKGNHDDNSITEDAAKLITDSVRYGYLGQQYTNQVVVNYGNIEKSYGYIDFKRQKVRAIFINTVDIPYDNALTYKGQHITGISNDQLNFIANALAFSETGWSVVFFSHHMLVNNATMNPTSDTEGYVLPTHGGDALWGIIQAFKDKTTYSKVSTLTDFNYSVSVDYTNNQSNVVLACISGHTHRDLSATQDGVLMISTTASGYGQTAYDSQGTQITFTAGTKTETAFDIYSFDRINGTIKASRYGAGQNRNWS
jgi:predicted phosphodiesterase